MLRLDTASRLLKKYYGTPDFHWSAYLWQQERTTQDAQKVRPARPQQVKKVEVEAEVE